MTSLRAKSHPSTCRAAITLTLWLQRGPSYFIKRPTNVSMSKSLRNEALIYRLFEQISIPNGHNSFAPRFHAFHEDLDALILEYISGVMPLLAYLRERQGALKSVKDLLGKIIGNFHDTTSKISDNQNYLRNGIELYEPPAFYLLTPSVSMYCVLSPANLQLLTELQRNQQLQAQAEATKRAWSPSCLVHGDLKWDNILVYPKEPTISPALRIGDWELAGIGDPAWDAASILVAYISHSISQSTLHQHQILVEKIRTRCARSMSCLLGRIHKRER